MRIKVLVNHLTPWFYEFINNLIKNNHQISLITQTKNNNLTNLISKAFIFLLNKKYKVLNKKDLKIDKLLSVESLKFNNDDIILNLTNLDLLNKENISEIKIIYSNKYFVFYNLLKEFFFLKDYYEFNIILENHKIKKKYNKLVRINFCSLTNLNRNFYSKLFVFIDNTENYLKLLNSNKYLNNFNYQRENNYEISVKNIYKNYFFKIKIFFLIRYRRLLNGRVFYWTIKKINSLEPNDIISSQNLNKINKIYYYADPFLFTFQDKLYIFFEKYFCNEMIGKIYCAQISENKLINEREIYLNRNKHYSYPYIFKYKDDIYMIPESSIDNNLQIWKCEIFPHKWNLYKELFIGKKIIDASVYIDEFGKIWLFANIDDGYVEDHTSSLYLYYLDESLDSQPIAHLQNPIKIDCSSSRGAGKIYKENGLIIRPSQINIKNLYGYGLNLNEIKILDLYNFHEISKKKIYPKGKFNIGIHHYAKNQNLILIDEHTL